MYFIFFFFNDTATTEIYTLSLHDALPISWNFRSARFTVYGTGGVSGFLVGLLANSRSRLYSSRGRVTFPEDGTGGRAASSAAAAKPGRTSIHAKNIANSFFICHLPFSRADTLVPRTGPDFLR